MKTQRLELKAKRHGDSWYLWTSERLIKLDISGLINGHLVDLAVAQMLMPLNEHFCRLLGISETELDHEYLIEAYLYIKPRFKTRSAPSRQLVLELSPDVEIVDESAVLGDDPGGS